MGVRWHIGGLVAWASASAPGCAPSSAPDSVTELALTFAGHLAGWETRRTWLGPPHRVERERTWVLALDGHRHALTTQTEVVLEDGWAVRWAWTDGASQRRWQGRARVPELVAPSVTAQVAVLDPWSAQTERTAVDVRLTAPGHQALTWTVGGVEAHAVFDPRGLVRWSAGSVLLSRVAVRPDPAPLDVVALLRVATSALPVGALVGRYEVDGMAVSVDAPLWIELPALPFVQPQTDGRDPLRDEATRLLAGVDDRAEAVRALVRHVSSHLDGRATPGSVDGWTALRTGRGDCTEHALAFASLASAAGLTVRVRGGLVYRDGGAGPGLYPHAWNEVRFAGRWVAVDAALGQAPADATHIPLGATLDEAVSRLASGLHVRIVDVR